VEDKVDQQQYNCGDTTMPEEAHGKVNNAYHDVKEKAKDHEQDHQRKDDPKPCTDVREIDCHFDSPSM